jgi:hypothetical protein
MTPIETSPDVIIGKSSDLVNIPVQMTRKLQSKKSVIKEASKPPNAISKSISNIKTKAAASKTIASKAKTAVKTSTSQKISSKKPNNVTQKQKPGPDLSKIKEAEAEADNQTIASRKILKFMRLKKTKSRSRYIKKICSDPGLCIAFDTLNRQKINEHFDFFTSLQYISDSIKQIGETSANGFVKEVKFTHDDYSAYAVLKSSVTPTSDNLVYEYLAGQYINHKCNYLPCFVETYGLFYYKNDDTWKIFKENNETLPDEFRSGLELQTTEAVDYAKACQQSKKAAILLQYIHGAKVLHSFISNSIDYISYQMIYQMPYLLYQIYFALAQLKNNFTHYDLHTSNIMLYEPKKGKYIEYVYHTQSGKEVRFRCPFLVKIIDYGRCFFKWDPEDIEKNEAIDKLNIVRNPALSEKERIYVSSPEIYKQLCGEAECIYEKTDESGKKQQYNCGKRYGFSWLDNPEKKTKLKYFISSSRSNMSHDLRLIYIVGNTLLRKKAHELNIKNRLPDEIEASADITELFKKVVYAVGLEADQDHSGTKENKASGLPTHINNVVDAEKALRELILSKKFVKINRDKYHDKKNKLGTLHIYADGTQMKFEK